MAAPATTNVDAEFACERAEAAPQRADDAGRDARGMPVHAHDGAERLEPERGGKSAKEFTGAVVMDDRLGDDRPEPRHALSKPCWPPAIMQWQIGPACPSSHEASREP